MLLNYGVEEDSWESLELQGDPTNPSKRDQSWVFIGGTDAKAEIPILWPPHAKSWLIGKVPDAGRDCGQEEKVTTEDEMVGWHHQVDGHGFVWTPGGGDGQGGLACCDSWGRKESTWLSNWTELSWCIYRQAVRETRSVISTSFLLLKDNSQIQMLPVLPGLLFLVLSTFLVQVWSEPLLDIQEGLAKCQF